MTTTVRKAYTEVHSSNIDSNAFLEPTFKALKSRALNINDFKKAKEVLAAILSHVSSKLFDVVSDSAETRPEQHPRDRRLSFFHSYIAPIVDNDHDAIVAIDRINITWRDCFRSIRSFPFAIDTRLEAQHIKHTSHPLRYNGDDFIFATLLSLPLSQAIAPYLDSKESIIPIAVPHSQGLFLGTAGKNFPDNIDHVNIMWKAMRSPTRSSVKLIANPDGCLTTDAVIRIHDSIAFRDFNQGHWNVYDLMQSLRQNKAVMQGMQCGLDIFSWGNIHDKMVSSKDHESWCEACRQVTDVIETLIAQANYRPMRASAKAQTSSGLFVLPEPQFENLQIA